MKQLPKKNTKVKTKHGEGKVFDTQILTQLVVVEYEDGSKIAVPLDEIEIISGAVSGKTEEDSPEQNIDENSEEFEEQ